MVMTSVVVILLVVCLVLTGIILGLVLGLLLIARRRNAQIPLTTTTEPVALSDDNTPETMVVILREIRDNLVSSRVELGISIVALVVALVGIGIAIGSRPVLVVAMWLIFVAIALNIGIFLFLIIRWWKRSRRSHSR